MFQVNDRIVYGTQGVCIVTAIGRLSMSVADKHRQYYTLCPVYQRDAVFYVPVDNSKVVMRPVLSREEADALIAEMEELDTIWIVNERDRETKYKAALLSCDCRELVKMIKTLYQRKKTRESEGKKTASIDERYFNQAEEQLYGELAYALDIEKEEVEPYIKKVVIGKKQEGGGRTAYTDCGR